MTTLERPQNGRQGALPPPELVSLPEDSIGPENVVEADWWSEYGGTIGADGLVEFPPMPPYDCPYRGCPTCAKAGGA